MNKAELVEKVAGEVGLTKKDVNNVVDAVTSAITDSLAGGEKVTLVGFGTFQVQKRKGWLFLFGSVTWDGFRCRHTGMDSSVCTTRFSIFLWRVFGEFSQKFIEFLR